jgi:hypothetical protein
MILIVQLVINIEYEGENCAIKTKIILFTLVKVYFYSFVPNRFSY